jgi:DNA-binding IclR family transcriptional regulator
MRERSLEEDLLRALRRGPNCRLGELADAVGVPRTNFGRKLSHRVREPLERLLSDGLIEERHGRYRLSASGRRMLAELEFGASTR